MVVRERLSKAKQSAEDFVVSTMEKYGFGAFGRTGYGTKEEYKPIYERSYSPQWILGIARQQSLVNNSIEEKVQQAFRRGFDDWEKRYDAKCPNCKSEFHSAEPFEEQYGTAVESGDLSLRDIDFNSERFCPECGEKVLMETPSEQTRDVAETFFNKANARDHDDQISPSRHASVSQSYLQVCREVARDIQTFDDGWMIFEKSYTLDDEGNVESWLPKGVYRAPPQKMRYSVAGSGKFGNEYWCCLECRSKDPESYTPQKSPGPCDECGNRTYEVFAYLKTSAQGDEIDKYFVQGEFAHDSEYWPSRTYGLSPIVSIADEAQSLQKMDDWYRSAYEQRRAPRGAIVLGNQNNESVRSWTQEQTQKLNNDPNHIPVFMGDSEGSSRPIEWISLLEEPAQMQHMQMREWFLDRVSAKFGVTQVFQSASAQSTGMSQSMEIVVSNRSAERLQRVFEDTFIPAFLEFLHAEGWERHLKSPEEEDESEVEQMMGRRLQNVQTARDLGLEVEWTADDKYDIKPTRLDEDQGDDEDGGGVGSMFGPDPLQESSNPSGTDTSPTPQVDETDDQQSNPSEDRVTTDEGVDAAGTTTPSGGRPEDANSTGGGPNEPDTPTSDEPYRRSEGAVTTDTSGYSSPSYSGKPGRVIDILQDIRDAEEEDDKMQKVQKLRRKYNECVAAADNQLPTYEEIERSVIQRPDTGFQAFQANNQQPWVESVEAVMFVEKMYEFIEDTYA